MSVTVRDDRVLPETRLLAIVVIPVLATAAIVLFGFPDRTADLFPWPIQAHMSSFALAVPYAAGIYYFTRVLVGRRWHRVAAGLLPVAAFVTAEGVATVLHWDRFTHDSPAFWLWAGLYLTTPFVIPFLWWRNRRTDPGTPEDADVALPTAARVAFLAGGLGMLAIAVFLLAFPTTASDGWPWPLTPLTARSTAGWFAFGLVGVVLYFERRWSAARIVVEAMLLGLVLALASVSRAWNEFETGRVTTWMFVTALAAALVLMLLLYTGMERRRRRA